MNPDLAPESAAYSAPRQDPAERLNLANASPLSHPLTIYVEPTCGASARRLKPVVTAHTCTQRPTIWTPCRRKHSRPVAPERPANLLANEEQNSSPEIGGATVARPETPLDLRPVVNRVGDPGSDQSKLIRSRSTTCGRLWTCVWIEPMYSPSMPMKKSWTLPRK
jgi:hypothetical protein